MKRQLLLSLAATLLALPALARDFEYRYEDQTVTYTVIDEDAKTVKTKDAGWAFNAGNNISGTLVLPANPKDGDTEYTLVAIGNGAFRECNGLTEVTIPESVTEIGINAFLRCRSLTSATIPNSVTDIGECAFEGCSSLISAIIPNSITKIKFQTFYECSGLTSITIPSSITEIGDWAFAGCSSLTSVINISEYLSILGTGAFSACTSLKAINVAAGNSNYTSIDGVLYSKDASTLIQYPAGKEDTKFIIPNSVTEIGQSAFTGSTTLSSVAIPNSVTTIGFRAFIGCSGLTSVSIPNSVETIYGMSFSGCSGLTSVTYLAEEPFRGYSDAFDEETYQNATLNYLNSAEAKIAATEPWCLFVNRIGRDADYKEEGAISEVHANDGAATAVYDMRGVKVGTSTDDLPKGIYIIREGATTRKVAL